MFKRFFARNILGLVIAAVGIGVLAAFMLPHWFLAVLEAALLIFIGFLYIK